MALPHVAGRAENRASIDILCMLQFCCRVKAEVGVAGGAADTEAGQDFDLCLRPEALDQACIEDLIAQHLGAELDVLPAEELALALHNFVEKDDKVGLCVCIVSTPPAASTCVLARQCLHGGKRGNL